MRLYVLEDRGEKTATLKWQKRAKLRKVWDFHILIGKWSIYIGIGRVD